MSADVDIAIVGGGAAGLATAIMARRANPDRSIAVFESARKPGAKILVSGGTRCNVTNRVVTDADFWGGPRTIVRRVLRAFPASEAVSFFHGLGVSLHEEADGKLFPDSERARDVLDALLNGVASTGARLLVDHRVEDIRRDGDRFHVITARGSTACRDVVLATGGQSLPKTGSDGAGFGFARRLGHAIVPTTPALVPLTLNDDSIHAPLSGVSHDVELALRVDGKVAIRLRGALLWTHFGISGPVALNMSRHWLRATLDGRSVALTASFAPGLSFDRLEAAWMDVAAANPRTAMVSAASNYVPTSVAGAIVRRLAIDPARPLSHLARADRRRLLHALLEWPLPVTGSRGYNYAEATAGGVPLTEVDARTLGSRVCPGLWLVGEILDVDGRIGGFNFQWAWSSAYVAAQALATAPPRKAST